jgi:glycerophosphoryl diester phosphodiesterase
VVIHDATLRRTGLMSGEVAQLSSVELSKVRVGSWFNRAHPELARHEYENQCIPSLAEVFQLVNDRPGMIYVEMKTEEARSAPDANQSVIDLIRTFRFERRVVVVSFDLTAIAKMKSRDHSIRTGALFSPRTGHGLRWRADTILKATADCGADEILLHRLLARPRLVERARDGGLPIVVWTVDKPASGVRARDLGIHALITNNPSSMLGNI